MRVLSTNTFFNQAYQHACGSGAVKYKCLCMYYLHGRTVNSENHLHFLKQCSSAVQNKVRQCMTDFSRHNVFKFWQVAHHWQQRRRVAQWLKSFGELSRLTARSWHDTCSFLYQNGADFLLSIELRLKKENTWSCSKGERRLLKSTRRWSVCLRLPSIGRWRLRL